MLQLVPEIQAVFRPLLGFNSNRLEGGIGIGKQAKITEGEH